MNPRPPDHDALFTPREPDADDSRSLSADHWQSAGDDAFRVGDFQRASLLLRRALDAPPPTRSDSAEAFTHALTLERLALIALAEGDPVFADIYALRSVRADPTHGPARVTQLRAASAAGRGGDVDVARLVAEHPELPSSHSFAGDIAWERGDLDGARRAWAHAAVLVGAKHERELDHLNRCLASICVDAAGTMAATIDALPFGLRDLESLAAAVVVALRYGMPLPDTLVPASALTAALVPWLELWIAAGAEEALLAFQRGAVAQQERLHGVDRLLNFG